jgi:dipeptidase D
MKISSILLFTFVVLFHLSQVNSLECTATRDAIKNLKPQQLWVKFPKKKLKIQNFFYEISCTPRCSENEIGIRNHIINNYAKKHNFKTVVDKAGNLVVYVPATKNFESKPTIIVQTHLDMVCEKNEGTPHDFTKDPIQILRDSTGDWVVANQTTLGADDGMGMAHSLFLGIDKTLNHGPLELLFTVGEEIGLVGALNISPDILTGKYLINIDSSIEDGLTIGR